MQLEGVEKLLQDLKEKGYIKDCVINRILFMCENLYNNAYQTGFHDAEVESEKRAKKPKNYIGETL